LVLLRLAVEKLVHLWSQCWSRIDELMSIRFILNSPIDKRIDTREQGPLALVLAPTRELAKQIYDETVKLSQFCRDSRLQTERDDRVKVVCMVGGESIVEQSSLASNGCDILIGTPGRILDCLERHFLVLNQANYVMMNE